MVHRTHVRVFPTQSFWALAVACRLCAVLVPQGLYRAPACTRRAVRSRMLRGVRLAGSGLIHSSEGAITRWITRCESNASRSGTQLTRSAAHEHLRVSLSAPHSFEEGESASTSSSPGRAHRASVASASCASPLRRVRTRSASRVAPALCRRVLRRERDFTLTLASRAPTPRPRALPRARSALHFARRPYKSLPAVWVHHCDTVPAAPRPFLRKRTRTCSCLGSCL